MLDFNPRPSMAERINALVDAALIAEREAAPPRTYLGASRLGHACERALQFEFVAAPKDEGADFGGQTLRIFAEVGRRVPVHSTAVGKVVMAGLPDDQARRILAAQPLEARTRHTLTSIAAVMDAVGRARSEGYAIDDEEQETRVRCIAVPVTHAGGLPVALSVSAPAERLTPDEAVGRLPDLQEVASGLARALG